MAARPEGSAFLARLLERGLASTTQLASRIRALVDGEQGLPRDDAAARELERLQLEVTELGWAIGRLGAELGADAMGPRHHDRGLELLVGLAGDELVVHGPLPRLAPGGRELALLQALVRAEGSPYTCEAVGEPPTFAFRSQASPPAPELLEWADEQGLSIRTDPGGWSLAVPRDWLHDGPPKS